MRRVMVLLFLAMGLVALGTSPAQACDVEPGPRAQQLETTPFVFSGEIRAAKSPKASPRLTRYTVEVTRIYRGAVDSTVTVDAPARVRNCGLRKVKPGDSLMFFAKPDKSAKSNKDDQLRTASFLGTSALNPQVRRNVEKSLGAGNLPEGKESRADAHGAVGTIVDDSKPPSITAAVVPGLGLMALGLLVLLLARIVGRPERP